MTKIDHPPERIKSPSQHRLRSWINHNQWILIGSTWFFALLLGYTGFARYAVGNGLAQTPWDLFYLTLQLIPMNSGALPGSLNWQLNVARYLIPLLTAFTALQAFAALFQQQANLVRLRVIQGHLVICGLSHKGLLLTHGFRNRGDQVVVIEKDENSPLLEQCRMCGAIVLVGDAADRDTLSKAGVSRAKAVIAVCENDGINAEIALAAREIVQARTGNPLTCIVHIVDPQIYSLFREREIEMEAGANFRLELFNIYSRGAQLLLQDLLFFNTVEQADNRHLVVIGLGMMGENLVVNAARLWHENHKKAHQSLCITVVDRQALRKTDSLIARYPRVQQYCELIPCELDIQSAEFQRGHFLSGSQKLADIDCFCVCLDDDSLSLYTGLALLQLTRSYEMPILVRATEITGLAKFLNEGHKSHTNFKRLQIFGLLERTCTPDLLLGGTHEILAQSIHEEYVLRQRRLIADISLADSMLPWETLPEQLKESNRCQADRIGSKLKSIGCRIAPITDWEAASFQFTSEEIEWMAQMEHESWMTQLISEGWKYAAGVKNPAKKTHPDLLPWSELPESEKVKNRTAVQEIPRFLARAGFQIER